MQHESHTKIHHAQPQGFAKYIPLIVMFALVVVLTFLLHTIFPSESFGLMRYFMGSFFLVFGFLKIIKLSDFAMAYREYDIVAMKSPFYAKLYPFFELSFAYAYFTNWNQGLLNTIVLVVMLVSALGVYLKLRKKEEIQCACLGTVFKVPMTWVTLIEDLLMAGMAAYMLFVM